MLSAILFVFFGFITAVLLTILWYQNYSEFFKKLNKIPGPKGYPVIGNVLDHMLPSDEMFKKDRLFHSQFYPVYKNSVLHIGAVNIWTPEDIEVVLSSTKHITKSVLYSFLHSWLGEGLIVSTGATWRHRRKLLTPAFHLQILKEFLPIFDKKAQILIKQLKECTNESLDIVPIISQFTLCCIGETAMGIKIDNSEKSRNYQQAVFDMFQLVVERVPRIWHYSQAIYDLSSNGKKEKETVKILHDYSMEAIQKGKDRMNTTEHKIEAVNRKKRQVMLDLLLTARENGAEIDDEAIREEVDTFMFAGHDTTSMAISYIILLMANHRDIQEKVYEELVDVLGEEASPQYDDFNNLPYLDRCIKECLRICPPVPFLSRNVYEDIQLPSGYLIPKGAVVNIHVYDVHHNPRIYPNPKVFDPDRFLPENVKERHLFAYIPFSAGPRNCIGQKFALFEVKTALCALLRNFIFEAVDTPDDITYLLDVVLRPKNGVKVKVISRK